MTDPTTSRFCIIFDQRAEIDPDFQQSLAWIDSQQPVDARRIDTPADAQRFAGQAVENEMDRIIAVGGDGMLDRIVNGILCSSGQFSGAVGLIPFGTGNDFARAAGIPLDNHLEAMKIAVENPPVPIDIGQMNDDYFINVVTGGFPAEAAAETPGVAKGLLGGFAYFLTGILNIGDLSPRIIHFSGPGLEWQGPVYAFGLGNGRRAGGGFSVCPQAVVTDGMLDLMIVPESKRGLVSLITDYLQMTRFDPTEDIRYERVAWVNVSSDETIHVNRDGEPVKGKAFRFTVHPRRLSFCLPEHSPILKHPESVLDSLQPEPGK